jgi:hypothetical protein
MSAELSGSCEAQPTNRLLALNPSPAPVLAHALDGHFLVYATDTEIHRLRLPARGTTAPPANDDFEHATPLSGELDQYVVGRIGHATLQPGEPDLAGAQRTVWYRFVARRTETLEVDAPLHRVYSGAASASLTEIAPIAMAVSSALDVVAGQTYWVQVGSAGAHPSYQPFGIGLHTWQNPCPGPSAECFPGS